MKPWSLALWLFFEPFLFAQTETEPQPFPDLVPAVLNVEYEHDLGLCAEIKLYYGLVTYKSNRNAAAILTRPTVNQWSNFIREINAAKLYKWSDHYPPDIGAGVGRDGNFHWSIELQIGERKFISDGNTNYPLDGDIEVPNGKLFQHKSYDLVMKAVSHLIGRDFFSN